MSEGNDGNKETNGTGGMSSGREAKKKSGESFEVEKLMKCASRDREAWQAANRLMNPNNRAEISVEDIIKNIAQ